MPGVDRLAGRYGGAAGLSKRAKRQGGKSAGTRYPTLRFGPATSWSGFTPTGVSGFNDLQPGVVVRELLQNALDAAVAAGESTAIVHFAVRTVRTADIPGCDEYRDALGSAVESQTRRSVNGTLPDNAQQVVDTITAALDRDTCSVLVILDNGIGLDTTSMDALLSDGTSAKQDAATGSYGNGHMVAIPASDLRYVLYGGVKQDATRIGAGHAVLASHTRAGDGHHRDADGYLVRGFGGGGEGHLYDYAAGKAVPPLIQRELDVVAERWGHGTAVVVPAFNSFREQRTTLWDLVSLSAACSFFAAVHHGRLRIEVAEPGTSSVRVLDSETLAAVLEYHKERKRRRSRSAPLGRKSLRCLGNAQDRQPARSRDQTWHDGDSSPPSSSERHDSGRPVPQRDVDCRPERHPRFLRQVRRPAAVRRGPSGRRRHGGRSTSADSQGRGAAAQQPVREAAFEA